MCLRPLAMSGFLQAQDGDFHAVTARNGFQTLHNLKTRRGSGSAGYLAIARMDRQTLAAGERVQESTHHRLVFQAPSQRSDHRWPQKEDAGGNCAYPQCLPMPHIAAPGSLHRRSRRARLGRALPRPGRVRRSVRPLAPTGFRRFVCLVGHARKIEGKGQSAKDKNRPTIGWRWRAGSSWDSTSRIVRFMKRLPRRNNSASLWFLSASSWSPPANTSASAFWAVATAPQTGPLQRRPAPSVPINSAWRYPVS